MELGPRTCPPMRRLTAAYAGGLLGAEIRWAEQRCVEARVDGLRSVSIESISWKCSPPRGAYRGGVIVYDPPSKSSPNRLPKFRVNL